MQVLGSRSRFPLRFLLTLLSWLPHETLTLASDARLQCDFGETHLQSHNQLLSESWPSYFSVSPSKYQLKVHLLLALAHPLSGIYSPTGSEQKTTRMTNGLLRGCRSGPMKWGQQHVHEVVFSLSWFRIINGLKAGKEQVAWR